MARVPVYRPFQVQQQVVGQPEAQVPNVQGPGQIAGEQMQQLGQALGQAGAQVGEFALRQQQRLNRLRVTEKTNTLIGEMDRLRNEYADIVGGDVLEFEQNGQDFTQHYRQQFQAKAAELGEGLFGADAQAEFNENIARMALRWDREVMTYHSNAVREWTETTAQDATIKAGVDIANSADSPGAVLGTLADFEETRRIYYQETRGESGNYDALIQADKEALLTGILNNLFEREDSTTFNTFFATVKDQLTEETAATFEEAAKGKTALDQAVAVVDEVLGVIKYDGYNAEAVDEEFRTRFADSPEQLEAARDEFKARLPGLNAEVGRQIELRYDAVSDLALKQGLRYAMADPRWNQLTGAEQLAIRGLLSQAEGLERGEQQIAQDNAYGEARLFGNDLTMGLSLDEWITTPAATDEMLRAMIPMYGVNNVRGLKADRDKYRADESTAQGQARTAARTTMTTYSEPMSAEAFKSFAGNNYNIDVFMGIRTPASQLKPEQAEGERLRNLAASAAVQAYQGEYRQAERDIASWVENENQRRRDYNSTIQNQAGHLPMLDKAEYITPQIHEAIMRRHAEPLTVMQGVGLRQTPTVITVDFDARAGDKKVFIRTLPRSSLTPAVLDAVQLAIPEEMVNDPDMVQLYQEARSGGGGISEAINALDADGNPTEDYHSFLEQYLIFGSGGR